MGLGFRSVTPLAELARELPRLGGRIRWYVMPSGHFAAAANGHSRRASVTAQVALKRSSYTRGYRGPTAAPERLSFPSA